MDLYENKDKNLMTATFELPGLTKDNVQIDIQNGNLAVSGETSTSSEQQEDGFAIKERKSGKFVRTIRLPDGTQVSGELLPPPRYF
jgi:HSP20 family protein